MEVSDLIEISRQGGGGGEVLKVLTSNTLDLPLVIESVGNFSTCIIRTWFSLASG